MMKKITLGLISVLALLPIGQVDAFDLIETQSLVTSVAAGQVPPISERVPAEPSIVEFQGKTAVPGQQGGKLNILMARKKDTRQMVVYGYARLVGYDPKFNIKPDILKKIEVKEGRIFTMHLRQGHKWSDGHPFTAEDFRYYWEDVATNEEVRNESPPASMIVDGERPKFEVLDDVTIRYSWSKPNPFFMPRLAGARPLYLYRPAHFMKKYHAKYTDSATLRSQVVAAKKRNWVALHYSIGQQYKNSNPDLPTLQPWMLMTKAPAKRFLFKRNPYYYRIDTNGRQLPYIDEVRMNVTNNKLIPIKTGGGESDLQARGLNFNNVTALKQSEKQSGFNTLLWRTAKGSHWALFPNLNTKDPVWRKIFRDVRFRRAISLGINRREINQVIYYGLAREGNNTVLPESPLYHPRFQKRWASFDVKRANALLDDMGFTKKTPAGIRLMPNGKRMELTVVFSTEESEPSDILELVRDSWRDIGIKIFLKPMQRDVLRNRIFSGLVKMSMWFGLENGIPSPDSSPRELAPTSQQQLQWPKWGQYVDTRGRAGEAVDMPQAKRLSALNKSWAEAPTRLERKRIWTEMLDIYTKQLFSIGIISSVPQVIVAKKNLLNVPKKAIYNWDPGAHFGVYRPDQFWLDPKAVKKRKMN
jgi:peptide/nickel transport system substrate-binding protein